MKEVSILFCHEDLLKKLYSTRADNLCKYYSLYPDDVSKELVKFKKLDELIKENIGVSNLLQEPNREDKEKDEDNLLYFDSENKCEETEKEEAGRKKNSEPNFSVSKHF